MCSGRPLKRNRTGLLWGFDEKTGGVSLSKCGISLKKLQVDKHWSKWLLTTTLMLPHLICLSQLWLQHTVLNQKAHGVWQGLFYSCIESNSPSVTHLRVMFFTWEVFLDSTDSTDVEPKHSVSVWVLQDGSGRSIQWYLDAAFNPILWLS